MIGLKTIKQNKASLLVSLFIYELIIGLFALFSNANALGYLFLSWVIPASYLLYLLRGRRLRYLIASFIWSFPASILIDLTGHYTKVWDFWSNPRFASTGIDLLGIPVESFVWGFLFWLSSVLIYEVFFDRSSTIKRGRFENIALILFWLLAVLVYLIITYNVVGPSKYFFLLLNLTYGLVDLVILIKYNYLARRLIEFGLVALSLGIIIELFSLALGLWEFNGEFYLITANLNNGVTLPLDELIWWFLVGIACAAVHEIVTDNQK